MYSDTNKKLTRPVTLSKLRKMKQEQEKFTCLTSYDATFTGAMNAASIETILIGDSLGMVVQGQDSTLPVSIEDMCYHIAAVKRGNDNAFLLADMPFMSYSKPEQALDNAAKLMQAGAHMVKLEGGSWLKDTIGLLTERGIPVCAHLGLTPQAVHKLGGYKVQGKDEATAALLLKESLELEAAGTDILLYECIPSELGKTLTEAVNIPTIGIGAGPHTDGQVLVMHDMLGVTQGRKPRFVKNFLTDGRSIQEAFEAFSDEVKSGTFPAPEHGF
ncbi:3-methyl-2-oxobutanoate hydroxymethyltransferase [Marinomonas mediterranea]|jgi:ketopantoate hydroxymethyltransferase (EC 2.1.2.11)|uniref:3-methyl-2-oxobutanoate hydroxymethyltransferase n=1 Tax=Marinomonas mediterranea (strain ATCC 700492 / JCM 21426 / NBRC 103028 / MMB-1) TaxID=717774 RepID=F2JV64_MARM1|nr:3-methyl-2-oxobutanoate hydroxymethyltransferase [Marinomonas mediterranea]ADZ92822.1 3-methyl-2-oxobutanoate hydroxymethyltransferase [Marinomonas mediterranea MMB-1]WCN10755.1 3-methyl-2-oxobutanoate hydroxymethyltransferase [Marinomonas mediterranea]WCN14812.1 3-methyl-2-oxobutanoate hydroxymethyltransferase [Marinomonas mediterranea]WCN18845.1 3-methyl-2-oxobutanoate hydroxymethyltransferase [Marinomonas mediterranea MMB-1]